MGRKLTMECPAAPENAFEVFEKERVCQTTYHIELVTPLFGGGAVAGENDPVTLIRGPGSRGNLRTSKAGRRNLGYGQLSEPYNH